jgi:hypothetical protein
MEVMLALPSEDSRLNLSFPVYSFPFMFTGGTHGSNAGPTLLGLAFKSLISCLFLSLMFAGGTHGSYVDSTLRGLAFKSLSSCLFLSFMLTGGTHGSYAGSAL